MKTVLFGPFNSIYTVGGAIFNDAFSDTKIETCQLKYRERKEIRKIDYAFSEKATKILPLFLRRKIYHKVLKYDFLKTAKRNEEICFIFAMYAMTPLYFFDRFLSFLKKWYKKAKFVFYSYDNICNWENTKIDYIKENFDLVMTFDKADAEKYGIEFYEGIYDGRPNIAPSNETSDLLFIGGERGKTEILLSVFKILSEKGIKCDFRIIGVKESPKDFIARLNLSEENLSILEKDGFKITYKKSSLLVNTLCDYDKTVSLIKSTKCMLDVKSDLSELSTVRIAEAMVYGKKLLTNCKGVKEKSFYREENICVFDDPEKIDISFFETPTVFCDHDFSSLKMIEYAKNKVFNIEK